MKRSPSQIDRTDGHIHPLPDIARWVSGSNFRPTCWCHDVQVAEHLPIAGDRWITDLLQARRVELNFIVGRDGK